MLAAGVLALNFYFISVSVPWEYGRLQILGYLFWGDNVHRFIRHVTACIGLDIVAKR